LVILLLFEANGPGLNSGGGRFVRALVTGAFAIMAVVTPAIAVMVIGLSRVPPEEW